MGEVVSCLTTAHWERRRFGNRGVIKWHGHRLFIADPRAGHVMWMIEVEVDLWQLHDQRTPMALIDGSGKQIKVRDPLRSKPDAVGACPPPPGAAATRNGPASPLALGRSATLAPNPVHGGSYPQTVPYVPGTTC